MEYVGERAKLYELNKVVKMWERKVEIAKVTWLNAIKTLGLVVGSMDKVIHCIKFV